MGGSQPGVRLVGSQVVSWRHEDLGLLGAVVTQVLHYWASPPPVPQGLLRSERRCFGHPAQELAEWSLNRSANTTTTAKSAPLRSRARVVPIHPNTPAHRLCNNASLFDGLGHVERRRAAETVGGMEIACMIRDGRATTKVVDKAIDESPSVIALAHDLGNLAKHGEPSGAAVTRRDSAP